MRSVNLILLMSVGVLILLVMPMVVAEPELRYQFNTDISINRPCFNNGSYCSPNSICNLTAFYPNGEILINNVEMTNQFSFYNVSLDKSVVNTLGIYSASSTCRDNTVDGGDTFEFEVTADGRERDVFPIQFAIMIFGVFMGCAGIFAPRLRLMKYLSGILLMVMGVVTIYPGYGYLNYSTLPGYAVGLTAVGLGFYFMIEDSLSFDTQTDHYNQFDDGRFHR